MRFRASRARVRFALLLSFLHSAAALVQGADVLLYSVVKSQAWVQTGPAEISRPSGDRFIFEARIIEGAPGAVGTAHVQMPITSVEHPLARSLSDGYGLYYVNSADIPTLAEFDTAYPNGTYVLQISTANEGNRRVSANLDGDAYPSVPQIANFSEAQQVNPEHPFTLSWFPFVGGTASDFIRLEITDDDFSTIHATGLPGTATPLNGTSTSATIPKDLLTAGTAYRVFLFFAKAVSIDRTSYPGATGYVGYGQTLDTTVQTIAASTPPSIVDQPESISAQPGETVLFSVEATGTPPLFYQWHLDGAVIPGANTSSFSIASAQLSDSGSYSVTVSNAVETVFSEPAQLTITSPDSFNGVLSLDGVGDYVSIPSSSVLQNPTGMTIECWVHPTATHENHLSSIINKGDGLTGASARSYDLRWTTDEMITPSLFFAGVAGQPDFISLSAPVHSNRWTHVAVTFDSPTGTARLLTNGVIAVEWEEPGVSLKGREIRQTTHPLVFGWAPTHPGTYMAGWLDEVRIWNRARSAVEVRAEMACKLTGQEPNLFGYWNFDDLTAADQTASGHNGTFSGDARAIVRATGDMGLIGCDPALFLSGQHSAAGLQWFLRGRIGSGYLIQSSTNLTNWADQEFLPGDRAVLEFKTMPSGEKAFYRAVLTP